MIYLSCYVFNSFMAEIPIIYKLLVDWNANQWTDFQMIGISDMNKLKSTIET